MLTKQQRADLIKQIVCLKYLGMSLEEQSTALTKLNETGFVGYNNTPDMELLDVAANLGADISEFDSIYSRDDIRRTWYSVLWEIDVDADTPLEAAQLARYLQDPQGIATCFTVKAHNRKTEDQEIDLDDYTQE